MKRLARITLIFISILMLSTSSVQAHGGGWGPGLILGLGLGAALTYPYYAHPYYPYYYSQPVYQQPQVYVQTVPQLQSKPGYWYYCPDPRGYYPYVKHCPNGWMKVVPSTP